MSPRLPVLDHPCPRCLSRAGHTLIEPLVALTVFAVGALGAAAVLTHAMHRLARSAQQAHTRDGAVAQLMQSAATPCPADARGVQPLVIQWTDSATAAVTVRNTGAPCAR